MRDKTKTFSIATSIRRDCHLAISIPFLLHAFRQLRSFVICYIVILCTFFISAVSDEQRPSLSYRYSQNSSENNGVDIQGARKVSESDGDVDTPGSELASLLHKWSSYQQKNDFAGNRGDCKRQDHITSTYDKRKLQNTVSKNDNENGDSLQNANIASPLKKYNKATIDGSTDIEYGTQNPQERLAKANTASAEEILVAGTKSAFKRNVGVNKGVDNKSLSTMKHLDHTSSILSRIDNCLSKSKNIQRQQNLFPLHQESVTTNNQRALGPGKNLCRTAKMSSDTAMFNRLTSKEYDTFTSGFVQRKEDDCMTSRGAHFIQENVANSVNSGDDATNIGQKARDSDKETTDKKNVKTKDAREYVLTNAKQKCPEGKLATTKNTGPRNDEKRDLQETPSKFENNERGSFNKNVQHNIETRGAINADLDNQLLNRQSKDTQIEETIGRSAEIPNIGTVYAKEDGVIGEGGVSENALTGSKPAGTEKMDTTEAESEPTHAENTHFPSERRTERVDAMDFLRRLQQKTYVPTETETKRDRSETRTDYLEDNAIVAVGVGGSDGTSGRAETELFRPGANDYATGIICAPDTAFDGRGAVVQQKRIKHRWRK